MNFIKLLLATALFSNALADELHTSTAIVEIHNTPSHALYPLVPSPNFIANEIASMEMGRVIDGAAKELQIEPKIIRDSLMVSPIEGTDLARISVTSKDKIQARDIANEVIKSYISHRSTREHDLAKMQLKALDEQLTLQGDLIQEHRKALAVLTQQYGIPYFEGEESAYVGRYENENYRQIQQRYYELETERDAFQARLDVLKKADPEKAPFIAAAIDFPNNPVARLYQEYQSLPASEKNFDQLIASINRTLPELTILLETKLQILEQEITRAEISAENFQVIIIDLSLKQNHYNQARNDYERSLAFYHELKKRQQEARVAIQLPKTPLTYHEKPE